MENLKFKVFESNLEASDFIEAIFIPKNKWYKEDGMRVYGVYYDTDRKNNFNDYYFVFGQLIRKEDLNNKFNNIFSRAFHFAFSSEKYKGLKSIGGLNYLDNVYDNVEYLAGTCYASFFMVSRGGKKALVETRDTYPKYSEFLSEFKYDNFFYANDGMIGSKKNGKIGFMNIHTKKWIENKYLDLEGYNIFHKLKAKVCLENGYKYNINPDGINVDFDIIKDDEIPYGTGTGIYPFGRLPNSSDAYDNDYSARWNTE